MYDECYWTLFPFRYDFGMLKAAGNENSKVRYSSRWMHIIQRKRRCQANQLRIHNKKTGAKSLATFMRTLIGALRSHRPC